jgi:hypothetical protein
MAIGKWLPTFRLRLDCINAADGSKALRSVDTNWLGAILVSPKLSKYLRRCNNFRSCNSEELVAHRNSYWNRIFTQKLLLHQPKFELKSYFYTETATPSAKIRTAIVVLHRNCSSISQNSNCNRIFTQKLLLHQPKFSYCRMKLYSVVRSQWEYRV